MSCYIRHIVIHNYGTQLITEANKRFLHVTLGNPVQHNNVCVGLSAKYGSNGPVSG
jgi:hypothetical protein